MTTADFHIKPLSDLQNNLEKVSSNMQMSLRVRLSSNISLQ